MPRFEERRFARGVVIALNRASPPFAALEDEMTGAAEEASDASSYARTISIESGGPSFAPEAARIRQDAANERARWRQEGLRLAGAAVASEIETARAHRAVDAQLAGVTLRPRAIAPALELSSRIARAQENAGPAALTEKGLSAAPGALDRIGSRRSGGRRLSGLAALFAPIVAEGGPELAQRFAVAAGATEAETAQFVAAVSDRPPSRPIFVAGRGAGPTRPALRQMASAPIQPPPYKQNQFELDEPNALAESRPVAMARADGVRSQVVVSGGIQLSEGLAITSAADALEVFREDEGQPRESGSVSAREGRYEILVGERTGKLIAVLRSAAGDALGRGEVDLAALGPQTSRFRFDQIDLKLAPVPAGFVGSVVLANEAAPFARAADQAAAAASGARVEIDSTPLGAVTLADGGYGVRAAVEGSSAIARVTKPGFWSSLSFVVAGGKRKLALFAAQAVESFLQAAGASSHEIEARGQAAIAWGRITKNGAPAAGARADLLTGVDGVRTVYFDEAGRPDPSLKQTSTNGAYAFFPVMPGVQMAQARLADGTQSETFVFPAEAGSVVRSDIESAFNRVVQARAFDAFRTSRGVRARIAPIGRERVTETDADGRGEARIASGDGMSFVDFDAGPPYAVTRLALSRDRAAALAPMVRDAWLDELAATRKISLQPATGAVVGFVRGARPFRARLDGGVVIYFDANGRATGEDFGRPGGGFAIFNAAEGLRALAVEQARSPRAATQIILVERNVASVSTFSLR